MATREVFVQVSDGWIDLAAAASPVLVEGKSYSVEWESRTVGYMRLGYDATPPEGSAGVKVFARNDPRVPPAFFTIPQAPGRIWFRAHEADIIMYISPADRAGDGSEAP